MQYHSIPIRMAVITKKLSGVGKDVERLEPSYIAGGKIKGCNTLRDIFAVTLKVKYMLIKWHDYITRYMPKHSESYIHTKTHMRIFIRVFLL